MKNCRMAVMCSVATLAIATSPVAVGTARAQAAGADDAVDGGIQDIVVTAQRRSEASQDVPISLQSFSSDALARASVRSTEDLSSVVGGLVIQPSAARPSLFVRGVGTNSSNTTPVVLTFIDGVYYPFGNSLNLSNIQSVEVLKGPQGTLFGRNATGGVIQITTKQPSETLSGNFEAGYGNYDTVRANAYVTGGIAEGVALDASLQYTNQGEGFGTNLATGDDVFFTKSFNARSRLRMEISDVTNLTLAYDHSQINGTVGTNVSPAVGYDFLFLANALRLRGPGQFFPGRYDVNAGPRTPFFRAREWGLAGTFETMLSDITLRSITSYRKGAEHVLVDFDGTPAAGTTVLIDRTPRTSFTQELQLISSDEGPFIWTAGAFYYRGRNEIQRYEIGANNARAVDLDKSVSIYAQGTYALTERTKLTLGGRYTIEKRSIEGGVKINGVEQPGRAGRLSQTYKEPTWRVALDHNFTQDAMVYASVSRGFNAGFYNQSNFAGFASEAQNDPVDPEFLTAYEVGTKLDLLNRRLRVNLAGFYYTYKGLQQQIYDLGVVRTINAGSARIKGVDFEVTVKPIPSLTLSASGTYLDSEYTAYPQAPLYEIQANGRIIATGSSDAKGNTIVNAPEISYTVSGTHVLDTAIGEFTTSANLNYRGKTWIDPANRFELPTRYVLNVSERWTEPNGNFFISVWAQNLLDEKYDYAVNVLTPSGLIGNTAPPRTYGATFGFEF